MRPLTSHRRRWLGTFVAMVACVATVACKRTVGAGEPITGDGVDTEFVAVKGGGAIQKRAVSAADYARCVAAGACSEDNVLDASHRGCTVGAPGLSDHPANCVSHQGAREYCQHIGAQLPTEALWLRAVGGAARPFPWGSAPVQGRANCDQGICKDQWQITAPVSALADSAAPCGAIQMAGNVFSWLADWYVSPAGTPPQLRVEARAYRLLKGGSWREHEHALRNEARHYKRPAERLSNIGFRCAR